MSAWGGPCAKCGHPASYHGATFCQVRAGAVQKRDCDCPGYAVVDAAAPILLADAQRTFALADRHAHNHNGGPAMTDYTNVRAVYFPADDDGNPDRWQVQAGEYADEPDVVIVVEHATDGDGNDTREAVAARIVRALALLDRHAPEETT